MCPGGRRARPPALRRSRRRRGRAVAALACAALTLVVAAAALGVARTSGREEFRAPVPRGRLVFSHVVVDAANPLNPHVKAAGDLDGDRFPDLVAGSGTGGGLYWYRYPRWTKHRIASGSFRPTCSSATSTATATST